MVAYLGQWEGAGIVTSVPHGCTPPSPISDTPHNGTSTSPTVSLRTREDPTVLPSPTSETVLTVAAFGETDPPLSAAPAPDLTWTLGPETQVQILPFCSRRVWLVRKMLVGRGLPWPSTQLFWALPGSTPLREGRAGLWSPFWPWAVG